jgi:hypothetical protein
VPERAQSFVQSEVSGSLRFASRTQRESLDAIEEVALETNGRIPASKRRSSAARAVD